MQEYGLTIHLGNSGTYESARILNKVISIPEADIPFVRVLFFFFFKCHISDKNYLLSQKCCLTLDSLRLTFFVQSNQTYINGT